MNRSSHSHLPKSALPGQHTTALKPTRPRVLICTPSNNAVDEIIRKLMKSEVITVDKRKSNDYVLHVQFLPHYQGPYYSTHPIAHNIYSSVKKVLMAEHGESLSRRHVETGKREKVGDQCTKDSVYL